MSEQTTMPMIENQEPWRLKPHVSVDAGHGENWRMAPWHPMHDFVTVDYINALEQRVLALSAKAELATEMAEALNFAGNWMTESEFYSRRAKVLARYDALAGKEKGA